MAKQISPTEATKLCDNYDAKYNDLSRVIGKEDNRSCSLSLEELKNYIDYLEKSKNNIDGICIYFGSYSNNEGPMKTASNNLTTVFLAPTSNGLDNKSLNVLNALGSGRPPRKKYS